MDQHFWWLLQTLNNIVFFGGRASNYSASRIFLHSYHKALIKKRHLQTSYLSGCDPLTGRQVGETWHSLAPQLQIAPSVEHQWQNRLWVSLKMMSWVKYPEHRWQRKRTLTGTQQGNNSTSPLLPPSLPPSLDFFHFAFDCQSTPWNFLMDQKPAWEFIRSPSSYSVYCLEFFSSRSYYFSEEALRPSQAVPKVAVKIPSQHDDSDTDNEQVIIM